MNIELTHKQAKVWDYLDDPNISEILYGGAAGGGKSFIGCLWLLSSAIQYPGTRWVMARAVGKRLKETTLATFFDLAKQLNVDGYFQYKEQSGVLRFTNGSEILLKDLSYQPSDPNYDSLGSLEITGAFIDEVSEVPYRAFEVLGSRIRYKLRKYNLTPKILMSCNPAKTWVYQEFYKPHIQGELLDYRAFIQALPTDNPFIDPTYLKNLEKLSSDLKNRLLYGKWEFANESALFDYNSLLDLFDEQTIDNPTRYISVDVARFGNDSSIVCLWEDYYLKKIYKYNQIDLVSLANNIKDIQKKYNVLTRHIIVDADGVGGGLQDILKCNGLNNNGKSDNYRNLKTEYYFKLAEKIKDGIVKIAPQDPTTQEAIITELEVVKILNGVSDTKLSITPKEEIKRIIGRSPDYADAIAYRMYFDQTKVVPTITIYGPKSKPIYMRNFR